MADLIARITYGDIEVEMTAEGASWNPDVASDLISRTGLLWKEALTTLKESGLLEDSLIDDDPEDDSD